MPAAPLFLSSLFFTHTHTLSLSPIQMAMKRQSGKCENTLLCVTFLSPYAHLVSLLAGLLVCKHTHTHIYISAFVYCAEE